MKILIECYGTFINETQSVDLLDVGQKITFDFFGEPLEIVLDRVTSYYYEVSTSHHFSIEKDGKVNMLETFKTFKIPYTEETILAMPIYDVAYKLKFSLVKEND